MFVDASAMAAVLLGEADAAGLSSKLEAAGQKTTSPLAVYEVVVAIVRVKNRSVSDARRVVKAFLQRSEIQVVRIDETEGELALDAFDRFGKGRHPARLNMGDCFAYASARSRGVPLLFKGDDFSQTDIAIA